MAKLALYEPALSELGFREELLSDEATMSYNRAWGGTITFSRSRWRDWYALWVSPTDGRHFYRYLKTPETGDFVGEIAFHYDPRQEIWLASLIVAAQYRGRGYGTEGLRLLCRAAAERGIDCLYDDIAADNPGISLFWKAGFTEVCRTKEIILLKKELCGKEARE